MRQGTLAWVGAGLWAALACTPEPERHLTVVVASLPLRSGTAAGAPAVATVKLGSPLKGTAPGFFDDKDHWTLRLNDGRKAYVPLESAVELTGQPVTLHVTAPEAQRLMEPYARGQVLQRVPMGTAVQVYRDQPYVLPGYGLWLADGRLQGFVQLEQLGEQPPTVDAVMARARTALLDGDLAQATLLARAAAGLDEKHVQANQLCVALLRAQSSPDAAVYRRRLPEEKVVLPPADPDLKAGVVAYVNAPGLLARRAPNSAARPVMKLSLNTQVAVKGTDRAWARVAWKGVVNPVTVNVAPLDPPPEPTPGQAAPKKKAAAPKPPAEVELYVPAGFLGPSPLDKMALRQRIKETRAAGEHNAAVLALQQLLALDPSDMVALKDLAAEALDDGQFDVAVNAVLRLGGTPFQLSGFDVEELEWLPGCRGDVAQAVLWAPTDEELARSKPRAHACLREVDLQPPCPPCENAADDGVDVSLFDRDMMAFRDAERARILQAVEAVAMGVKAQAQRVAKVEQGYPSRGVCHVRLRNRQSTSSQEGLKLVVGVEDGPRTAVLALPAVGAQQFADLWLRFPSPPSQGCALFNARNADAVRKQWTQVISGEPRKLLPPHREVAVPRRVCGCFGKVDRAP